MSKPTNSEKQVLKFVQALGFDIPIVPKMSDESTEAWLLSLTQAALDKLPQSTYQSAPSRNYLQPITAAEIELAQSVVAAHGNTLTICQRHTGSGKLRKVYGICGLRTYDYQGPDTAGGSVDFSHTVNWLESYEEVEPGTVQTIFQFICTEIQMGMGFELED